MSEPAPPHVARVLERLTDVRRSGNGWSAKCPAHPDAHASLAVSIGEDGRTLLHCFAGCTVEQVCKAIEMGLPDLFPESPGGDRDIVTRRKAEVPCGKIAKVYDYNDENGKLLYQVVRLEPKSFRQRRPTEDGGWIWNLKGTRRVLYRLPALLTADPSLPVYITEGEKDCDNVSARGLVATTSPGGAGKWRADYNEAFVARHIVLLPHNDRPGIDHAEAVAWAIHGTAASVRILQLPNLPAKGGDVSDWLAAGGTAEQLQTLADKAPRWQPNFVPGAETPEVSKDVHVDSAGPKQADVLIELAGSAELFHAPDTEAFATVPVAQHRETYRVRGTAFRRWLVRAFYRSEGKAPGAQAVQDALGAIAARAHFDGPEVRVHVRCAEYGGAYWLDLGDAEWRAVKIAPVGWAVVDDPPVKFIRASGMLALPEPQRGGSISDLRPFVNVPDAADWALLLAWIVAALRPKGPYPILVLTSEAGSAKSTLCRTLRMLIDPNTAPLRSEPREARDLFIAATNAWVVTFDNMSCVRPGLSDDLCRLATGGGFATRQLYTDSDENIFDAMRPVLLNGIDDLTSRGDLSDRALVLMLPPIPEHARRTEATLFTDFGRVRADILGALLDAVATAMRRLPTVKLAALPRMADFAIWATAAEPALGLADGEFLRAYTGNIGTRTESILEGTAIAAPLLRLLHVSGRWSGTARELLVVLSADPHSDRATRDRRDWPKSPRALSGDLRRLAPTLRQAGFKVILDKRESGGSRRRIIDLEWGGDAPVPSSRSSRDRAGTPENADSGGTITQDRSVPIDTPTVPTGSLTVPYRPYGNRVPEPGTGVRDGRDGLGPAATSDTSDYTSTWEGEA